MPKNNESDAIKEVLTKIGLPTASTNSEVHQTTRTIIQQNLVRFYQENTDNKAFTLPENQAQFLQAIFKILDEMPYMAEQLVEYHSFNAAIRTMITRNTWKNF